MSHVITVSSFALILKLLIIGVFDFGFVNLVAFTRWIIGVSDSPVFILVSGGGVNWYSTTLTYKGSQG